MKRSGKSFGIIILLFTFLVFTFSCVSDNYETETRHEDLSGALYKDPSRSVEERTANLLSLMTLEEKLGQMAQVDQSAVDNNNDVTRYFIGSLLSGGGSCPAVNNPSAWADLYDSLQKDAMNTRLGIPMIYGIDAIHGHNNVKGAVIFPHNIALGATGDPELVKEIGRITALEVAATGIDWDFAPCIAVSLDERWGRTYEGYSEYTPLVAELGAAYIEGMQGADFGADPRRILACAKHFAGDGGTKKGVDQGNTVLSEEEFRRIHLAPYENAIAAGVDSIMISFSSINGEKMHGNKYYVTDVLKGEMGFQGIIVSDWAGIDQVAPRYRDALKQGINAGIDMVMIPYEYQRFLLTMKALVEEKEISMERIDEAVTRILRVKFKMGLFEKPFTDRTLLDKVGSDEHRQVAREAVRKSLVLLKNKNGLLPLSKNPRRLLVAGAKADDVGSQCGGWTISWQGSTGDITPGTTVIEAVKAAVENSDAVTYDAFALDPSGYDAAIVVVGETPYAEMRGDNSVLELKKNDIRLIENCKKAGVPVVVVLLSGRPLIITEVLDSIDALVAAWLPGTEGAGITDVLFGDYEPVGKLSYSWPRSVAQIPVNYGDVEYDPLFPFGYGLTYQEIQK